MLKRESLQPPVGAVSKVDESGPLAMLGHLGCVSGSFFFT
jgi:hypothetical protein